MADLHIQKLDDETINRLKNRDAQRGISVEEEARQILQQAVTPPEKLGVLALQLFGPTHGIALNLPERESSQPLDFSK